ncbi:MAG: HPF/RaiA family ribosome-associated protein [Azoarcus sp.]|jgi:ribosome-associated translation inhibitor RaiA|nr:HPF/RaiA family ribosome-associated protein [Azoarcus sp.]
MQIDLRCEDTESLHDYVMQRMNAAMAHFRGHVRCARIKVANAANANGGGQDKRCVVQLRLRNLPDVVFAITRLDARAAVDEAAARTARTLARRLRRNADGAPPSMALSRQAWYSLQSEVCISP